EPGVYNDVITQMPEHTSFDVIGASWCVDGYRWWQIQLDDGTTGYAAEASADEYWLEPVK
ncbi:MAG TPA: SH3 domain-containing protein, partial [Phototrophicaceae bacterium]|nr:SH3 domain-containing protein [Phototrophicaceae bacterium]